MATPSSSPKQPAKPPLKADAAMVRRELQYLWGKRRMYRFMIRAAMKRQVEFAAQEADARRQDELYTARIDRELLLFKDVLDIKGDLPRATDADGIGDNP